MLRRIEAARFFVAHLFVVFVILLAARAEAQPLRDPAEPGSFPVRESLDRSGGGARYDVYCPEGGSEAGVVLANRAGGSRQEMGALARHLASHGFVAVVPDAPPETRPTDIKRWVESFGSTIADILDLMRRESELRPDLGAAGIGQCLKLDALSVVGFEAGALVSQRIPGMLGSPSVVAVVMLNPPDDPIHIEYMKSGAYVVYGRLPLGPPHLVLTSEEGRCFQIAPAESLFQEYLAGHARTMATLRGASACDLLAGPPDCAARCGVPTPGPSTAARRYVTAWLLLEAKADERARAFLPRRNAPEVAAFRAEDEKPSERRAHVSTSITAGGGGFTERGRDGQASSAAGLTVGFRPELAFSNSAERQPRLGGYLEALVARADFVGGGGVSFTPWRWATLSAGPYLRNTSTWGWEPGLASGLFLGCRGTDLLEFPVGVRVDGRLGLGDAKEKALTVSLQVDLLPVVAAFIYASNLR
jgi:hypothetical protein